MSIPRNTSRSTGRARESDRNNFVGVTQQRAHQALVEGLERDDVLAAGQHHPPDGDLVHLTNGLADHCEGIMADFAVGPQVVRADDVAWINLVLDGAGGFQGDVFEFFLGDLHVGVGVDLEGLDDVFARDLLAGLGIHAAVFDAGGQCFG
jgi:hypothetical protein